MNVTDDQDDRRIFESKVSNATRSTNYRFQSSFSAENSIKKLSLNIAWMSYWKEKKQDGRQTLLNKDNDKE